MSLENPEKSDKFLNIAIAGAALSVVFYASCHSVSECLWGNLMNGLDFIAHGGIIAKDSYSYMSDVPWIDHEWLFEIVLAKSYLIASNFGMNAFKLLVDMCFFGLIWWHLRSSRIPSFYSAIVLVLLSVFLAPWILAPRPQIIDLLFYATVACSLAKVKSGNKMLFYSLPMVFALWANMHAGFVAGLGILAVWCFFDLIEKFFKERAPNANWRRDFYIYAAIATASALAVLVNPYGPKLPAFLFSALSMPHDEFPNWHPISINSLLGKFYAICILAVVFILFKSKREKSIASIAAFILVCLQPLSAYRHTFFVFISAIAFFAGDLAYLINTAKSPDPPAQLSTNGKRLAGSCLLIFSLVLLPLGFQKLYFLPIPQDWPLKAVTILKDSGVSGNLAVNFDWSDYALWHLKPKIKVSVDSRRETAFSAQAIAANLAFTMGAPNWDDILKKYPTTLVLSSKKHPEYPLMLLNTDWQLCYEDDLAAVFARKDSKEAKLIMTSPANNEPMRYQFP